MGERLRSRIHPDIFEQLESRILLDGFFDAWVSNITDTVNSVPAVDVPTDTSSGSTGHSSGSTADTTTTDYTDYNNYMPVVYPPGRPLIEASAALSNASVQISWYQPDYAADGFYITRRGPDGTHVVAQVSAYVQSHVDQGLAAGRNYRYTVTAFNGGGEAVSNAVTVGTLGDHLTVTQQPGRGTAGAAFGVAVDLRDASNTLDTAATSTLSVSVANGPRGANLGGPVSVQANHGAAVFSGLTLNLAGAYQFAVSDGISTVNTGTFIVDADPSSAHLVLLQQPQPAVIGKKLNLRFAVDDAFGNLVGGKSSTAAVTLISGPGTMKGTFTATVKNGNVTFGNVTLSDAGTYTMEVSDAALPGPALQFTQVVAPAATKVGTPGVARGGYVTGKAFTLAATLTSVPAVVFGGDVTLVEQDGTLLGTAPVAEGGGARFSLDLTPGTYTASLHYAGDANHTTGVSRSFTFQVTSAPTTTTLQTSAGRLDLGQALTLKATVAADVTPGGTITFFDGSTAVGTAALDAGFSASLVLPQPALGGHTFAAVYSGDGLTKTSHSKGIRVTVARAPTAVTLVVAETHMTVGAAVTLTLNVTSLTAAGVIPGGKIQIKEAGKVRATLTLTAGMAVWSPTGLKPGTHTLTATYLGDARDLGSVSATVTLTV